MSISDSLSLMLAFAGFILMLLHLIIEIIKNTKK